MDKTLGIYIHIPFCASKCGYCDFYSVAGCDRLMPKYQDALVEHIRESYGAIKSYYIDSVYFGGGTPSYYGADRLLELWDELRGSGRVLKSSEVTVEVNPDSASVRELEKLRKAGFNRISLGVQSANNDILKLIGRRHNWKQVEMAVGAARDADFDNLSIDLIYGLPGQSLERWQENLSAAVALEPEHLSCYGLKVEESTPLWRMQESLILPDDDLQADMYLWAVDFLERRGYAQYEISNFARPGYEGKHNLIYWDCGDYLGIGPAAHSCMGGKRFYYPADTEAFLRDEAAPVMDGGCGAEDYLILQLRLRKGLSLDEYKKRYGREFSTAQLAFVKNCVKSGYANFDGHTLALTPAGLIVQNSILAELL